MGEFKSIRTVTVTRTHMLSLYKILTDAINRAEDPIEKQEAQELLDRFLKQTKFKLPIEEKIASPT